jgi:hypothetical protein
LLGEDGRESPEIILLQKDKKIELAPSAESSEEITALNDGALFATDNSLADLLERAEHNPEFHLFNKLFLVTVLFTTAYPRAAEDYRKVLEQLANSSSSIGSSNKPHVSRRPVEGVLESELPSLDNGLVDGSAEHSAFSISPPSIQLCTGHSTQADDHLPCIDDPDPNSFHSDCSISQSALLAPPLLPSVPPGLPASAQFHLEPAVQHPQEQHTENFIYAPKLAILDYNVDVPLVPRDNARQSLAYANIGYQFPSLPAQHVPVPECVLPQPVGCHQQDAGYVNQGFLSPSGVAPHKTQLQDAYGSPLGLALPPLRAMIPPKAYAIVAPDSQPNENVARARILNDPAIVAIASHDPTAVLPQDADLPENSVLVPPEDAPNQRYGSHKRYVVQRKIGSGAFGKVYFVYDVETGEPLAVKVMPVSLVRRNGVAWREYQVLKDATLWAVPGVMHLVHSWADTTSVYFVMVCKISSLCHVVLTRKMQPLHVGNLRLDNLLTIHQKKEYIPLHIYVAELVRCR